MFDTVLVADRGLVACRAVRACQRLGARAVTVHSAADADRLHSRCADESLLLGPSDPASTYLDGLKLIEAAGQSGAQAVHPGASPLAASAAFATAVQGAGLTWVGPPPAALARIEAPAAPGAATDVVVTVLAPTPGLAVPVGDSSRDAARWSSPAALSADVRGRARAAAVDAVTGAGLVGLVQVAVDPARAGVTGVRPWLTAESAAVELVTGLDLVEQQLLIAAGKDALDGEVRAQGAAVVVELRARSAGRLERLVLPEGGALRVERGTRDGEDVEAGDVVVTVAAWADTDRQAHERLAAARGQLVVDGIELEEGS